jgi:4-diphosphocytidyl-2-C-methyl-D-erythritol kinase
METLRLPSYAKINLLLRILGGRPDGYHELDTVYQTVSLQDTLTFHFDPGAPFSLVLEASDNMVPSDQSNLICRACFAFHEEYPIRHAVRVEVEKRIPMASGLGGGSSNAAVALIALSRLYDWPLCRDALRDIAARLGADVPFFLTGGTARGTGRGDIIEPVDDLPSSPVLIVRSPVTCSTPDIYREYDERGLLTGGGNSTKIPYDWRPESLKDLFSHIENDLEQVVFALYPELDSIKKRLLDTGAEAASLSGSGSAVFGLFKTVENRERAARHFPECSRCTMLSRGEYVRALGLRE